MDIQEHVMKNVDELNLKTHETYANYFDTEINRIANMLSEKSHIPFIIHTTCACGCGEISYQINYDIISKQKAAELLFEVSEQLRKELTQLN